MSRRWQLCGLRNAAHSALASDDAAQPSSLAGSAEQPADESYRRAWDGQLYTRAEFHEYYGCYVGEAHWQNAQDETNQSDGLSDVCAIACPRRRSAEQLVAPFVVKRIRLRSVPRCRNADQPAASLYQAAQLASHEVHNAAHAKHTEYMMFLQGILNDFYDIWRSVNEPKKLLASWSSQWNNLTRTLEAIARDAAAHNCLYELDCSLSSVAQPASIEKLPQQATLIAK